MRMRTSVAIILLCLITSCSTAGPERRVGHDSSEPASAYIAVTCERENALEIAVLQTQGDTLSIGAQTQVPYPHSYAQGKQAGGRQKICAAVSGGRLLVSMGAFGEQPSSHLATYALPNLTEPVCRVELTGAFVTALAPCDGGWLIGMSRASGSDVRQGWELAIEQLNESSGTLNRVPVWSGSEVMSPSYRPHTKEIDAFARYGRSLIALDNVVSPKYAIELTESGGIVRAGSVFDLPSGANESYFDAAMHDRFLVSLTQFSTQGAQGHRLRAFNVSDEGLVESHESVEYMRRVRRDGEYMLLRDEAVVLAGTGYTPWYRVTVDSHHVIVAAGKRGLMVFQRSNPEFVPQLVDAGGECIDIKQCGDYQLVLVATGEASAIRRVVVSPSGDLDFETLLEDVNASRFAD